MEGEEDTQLMVLTFKNNLGSKHRHLRHICFTKEVVAVSKTKFSKQYIIYVASKETMVLNLCSLASILSVVGDTDKISQLVMHSCMVFITESRIMTVSMSWIHVAIYYKKLVEIIIAWLAGKDILITSKKNIHLSNQSIK